MTSKINVSAPPRAYHIECQTLIIGAGACGMIAALSAHEQGQRVLVIEADSVPSGSTALSAGLIPAAGTAIQRAAGIDDNPDLFAADIQAKAKGENDQSLVEQIATDSAEVIDWLTQTHGLPFSVVDNFDYPGHSRRRMHGLPTRSGAELIDALRTRCEALDIDIICERRAFALFHEDGEIVGVAVTNPDGTQETIKCARLILACNGFGGNSELVERHLPQIKDGLWFGHDGNKGEAILWAEKIDAQVSHLGAYQGHGNVAHPHGILITWAVITEGGFQVNRAGQRFWNETEGYSEAARAVLAQPGGEAFAIFDERIAKVARQFEDFKRAEAVGAVKTSETIEGLATQMGLPAQALRETHSGLPIGSTDEFGRAFHAKPLSPAYFGVRVTGALFHTQGGLQTNASGRVIKSDGQTFRTLFAGGGAACGISGSSDYGYLSGNGLLSAAVLGRNAGKAHIGQESGK